jgi:hypothetical protein
MTSYLVPNAGRGRELMLAIRDELGVPEGVVDFSVHFKRGDVIRVDCTFIPADRSGFANVTTVGEMVERWQTTEPQA